MADQMIVEKATPKVVDGDVILTFAYSHVVAQVRCSHTGLDQA